MRLVMVRHGESDGNAGNPYEGAEPHLTERGRRQARYAAERARQRPYQALYTSPCPARSRRRAPWRRRPGCSRSSASIWRRSRVGGFPRLCPLDSGKPLPHGHSAGPVYRRTAGGAAARSKRRRSTQRAGRSAAWLRERHEATDDRVLLVTHGGFGSALLSIFLGLPPCGYLRFWMANCGYTVIDVEPGAVRL